jgi:hypothetical protein
MAVEQHHQYYHQHKDRFWVDYIIEASSKEHVTVREE